MIQEIWLVTFWATLIGFAKTLDYESLCRPEILEKPTSYNENFESQLLELMQMEEEYVKDSAIKFLPFLISRESKIQKYCEAVKPRQEEKPQTTNCNQNNGGCKLSIAPVNNVQAINVKNEAGTLFLQRLLVDFLKHHDIHEAVLIVDELHQNNFHQTLPKSLKFFSKNLIHLQVVTSNKNIPKMNSTNDKSSCFVILSDFQGMKDTIDKYESHGFMSSQFYWFMNSSSLVDDIMCPFDSNCYTYSYNDGVARLNEVFRIEETMQMETNFVGIWSESSGLVISNANKWDRRSNMRGIPLVTAIAADPPYVYINRPEGINGPLEGDGLAIEIWTELQKALNFTAPLVDSIDGAWGARQADGTFNGIIGMLERNEIDAGVSSFGLLMSRASVADYIGPLGLFIDGFYYKVQESWDITTYISPFANGTWLLIAVNIVFCSMFFYLVNKVESRNEGDDDLNYLLGLFVIISSAVSQGSPYEPKKGSSRMIFLIIFMASFVILSSYSASLTSFLAVKQLKYPFSDSLTLHNSVFKAVTVKGTSYVDIFQFGTPVQQEIFKTRLQLVDSLKEGVEVVRNQPNTAILWTSVTMDLMFQGSCDIKAIPKFKFATPFVFYLRKHSPYRELMNHHVAKMIENGQLNSLRREWFPKKDKSCESLATEAMGMPKVFSIFLFLALSIPIVAFIVALEVGLKWHFHNGAKKQSKKNKSQIAE